MSNPELEVYVRSAHAVGVSDDALRSQLAAAGWSPGDIASVVTSESPYPAAPGIPNTSTTVSASHFGMWVAFEYILFFITLAVSAIALAGILHYGVDQWLPDATQQNIYSMLLSSKSALFGYLAGLIIAFPIFAFLLIFLTRQVQKQPLIRGLRARKVFIYIALVWTFIVLISRLVRIVYGFLEGTVVLNSVAHVGVTFLTAGVIFISLILIVAADRKADA